MKTLKTLGVLALALVLLLPFGAHAAVNRAVIGGATPLGDGTASVLVDYYDNSTYVTTDYVSPPTAGITTNQQFMTAILNAVSAYASGRGWTLTSLATGSLSSADVNSLIGTALATSTNQANWTELSSSAIGYIKNKPPLATVATSGSYNDLSNQPTIPTVSSMSFNNPGRVLNTAFQISSTRAAFVSYTVDVSATLTVSGGATGTVTLQYADDSGFTTNVVNVQSAVNGNTGALTIGLSLTQTGTAAVSGVIPAGKYVRIATANTAGTPSFTFRAAQEVLTPSN